MNQTTTLVILYIAAACAAPAMYVLGILYIVGRI